MNKNRVSVRIANNSGNTVEFRLEPWGEIYPMPPQTKFLAVFEATTAQCDFEREAIELSYGPTAITLWGISGCDVTLSCKGRQVTPQSWPFDKELMNQKEQPAAMRLAA